MRDHLENIAQLPRKVGNAGNRYEEAFILACDLKYAGKSQAMREAAVEVLKKHARVRSEDQYFRIVSAFACVMSSHEDACIPEGLPSLIWISRVQWRHPVHKRWRLVRKAVELCRNEIGRAHV